MVTCWHFKNWSVGRLKKGRLDRQTPTAEWRATHGCLDAASWCWLRSTTRVESQVKSVSRHKTRAEEKRHAEKQQRSIIFNPDCNINRKKKADENWPNWLTTWIVQFQVGCTKYFFFLMKPNGHKKLHSVNQSSFLLRTEKRMLWHAGLFSLNCELCHWRRTTHEASSLVDSVISEEHFRPFSLLFSSSPSCPIF